MNQREYNDLVAAGFTGALNDMKRSSFLEVGSTSLTLDGAMRQWLISQGGQGANQDMLLQHLKSLGFTGSVNDLVYNSHLYELISNPGGGEISGTVFSLDAKNYTSGQKWINDTLSPSDGSLQTGYDYFLGGGGTVDVYDPVITNAGQDTAYWLMTGSKFFNHAATEGVPNFLRKLHHAGGTFTIISWFQWTGADGANICPIFDSGTSDRGGSDMSRGVIFCDLSSTGGVLGRLKLRIKQDSSAVNSFSAVSDVVIPSGQVNMVAASYKANDTTFLYMNGSYAKIGGADTVTATLTSPGTLDSSNIPRIGTRGDNLSSLPSGTRIHIVQAFNRNLSKEELDSIWNSTKGRFGL